MDVVIVKAGRLVGNNLVKMFGWLHWWMQMIFHVRLMSWWKQMQCIHRDCMNRDSQFERIHLTRMIMYFGFAHVVCIRPYMQPNALLYKFIQVHHCKQSWNSTKPSSHPRQLRAIRKWQIELSYLVEAHEASDGGQSRSRTEGARVPPTVTASGEEQRIQPVREKEC